MQHVRGFESSHEQKHSITPLRVTVVQPSLWERMKAKAEQKLSTETIAEAIFSSVTILLTTGIFVALARALAHYTIVPVP